ncbi:unnamed protein product [Brachionus calyciflorus]|uniref:Uncharacterized protein n=1 Tax=Brachionus calyciflorus TaxID=104777 RepID=A0A814R4J3_9BILA|nr:unnamed protein product [Brachionus calyciflorus]
MSRLIDIVNILEPFEFVTNEIQGETYSSLSLVVPSLFQIINDLNEYEPKNRNLKVLKQELESQLKNRFNGIFCNVEVKPCQDSNFSDFSWFISSFLDPFFRIEWLEISSICDENKKVFIEKLKQFLIIELGKIRIPSNDTQSNTQSETSSPESTNIDEDLSENHDESLF